MGVKTMEAAIQEQILSLEELSNDLIAANLDNLKIKEDVTKDGFEDIVQLKLENIRNVLENTENSFDLVDDVELHGHEYSNDSILKLLETIKSDIISLDDSKVVEA